ncbi:hypothetical protein BG32_14080 [Mesotoga sp. HF07.pep.5.2.highcov]|nr:hypothetical protein BG32_14080 [Mesotoga sp. HF07.pep.5.2.highcov]
MIELVLWRNGYHQGQPHGAGRELTRDILADSPHGTAELGKIFGRPACLHSGAALKIQRH